MSSQYQSKGRSRSMYRANQGWSEYQRMLSSAIHWRGDIPTSFDQCQQMDNGALYEIIHNINVVPAKIRNEQMFINALNENVYRRHKSYIHQHLNIVPLSPPANDNYHDANNIAQHQLLNDEQRNEQNHQQRNNGCSACIIL
mmetsp:Transcript_15511/g.13921  ORF Transcript_15511/g.13921 Transcript_15511/m.13921 type:complete len:142 (-) Transcript_15511:133-558(-)